MEIPSNVIAIWSGSIGTIPAGWVICDGNNGTPDLRDRFILGAGSTYAVDETGGALTHTHTFTTDGHTHFISYGGQLDAGTDFNNLTNSNTDSGTTNTGSSLPPYYSLAFIMKT